MLGIINSVNSIGTFKCACAIFATFWKSFAFLEFTTSTISKLVLFTEPISEISHNFSTSQPLTIPSGKISTNLPPALHGE